MTPKGPRANVRAIGSARPRGRPGGLGYDPTTGEENAGPTLERRPDDSPETDIFTLIGQRGYSEDRFYTKATNDHNHSKVVRLTVPQGIDAQIHGAVNTIPEYRNVHDLVRDAIVHRLEYLQKRYRLTDVGRRFLELERMRADSDHRSREIDLMTETVTDLEEKLTKAWQARDYGMLAAEIEAGEELLDWLREPYASQARQIIHHWRTTGREAIASHRALHED